MREPLARRRFLATSAAAVAAALAGGCASDDGRRSSATAGGERPEPPPDQPDDRGLLAVGPGSMTDPDLGAGVHALGLGNGRDGLLWVPPGHQADRPVPLAVMFHGAGGDAAQAVGLLRAGEAADPPIAVLAPESRGVTWDFDLEDGADLTFVQRALTWAFERVAVDERSVVTGGFSDGASYALSLGLGNGELFGRVVAFSPGFMAPAAQRGQPRIFVSHGIADTVLPIDRCSRRIVASLRAAGYDVAYDEFDGGHVIPPDIVTRALRWLGLDHG